MLAHLVDGAFDRADRRPDFGDELLASGRQRDATGSPVEQPDSMRSSKAAIA
jgi:hypothetical protein